MTLSAARRLARFVVGPGPTDAPGRVVQRAGLLALDTLGCCLAAARYDFGRAARATAERLGGPPESALIGSRVRVAAANAALANVTLAHGLDFDDTREDAIVHTGSVAVTTGLAVGEAAGATGRATLDGIIAGVEVMCRVGLAVPGKFHARHYHPTALAGTFGAAAAAGRLYALTEDELVHAFGICGSQASGIIEYLADGSWTKRLHAGWAAHAGVVATLLARARASRVRSRSSRASTGSTGLSRAAWTRRGSTNCPGAWEASGSSNGSRSSPIRAVRGRRRPRSGDPGPRGRVGYELDPTIDYPRQFVGHVRVRLRDGRVVDERQDHPRGGPDSPMTRDEIESKFRGNASLVMSTDQASRVVRTVDALGAQPNLRSLMESLTL